MAKLKFFITHSWHDIEFTRRLFDDLKAQGLEGFLDDKTLQGGHRMAEEINRGLEWCDVYIPVLSRAALESPWCWEEINAAISLANQRKRVGRPRIIPVLAEDCELPALLSSRLYFNFTDSYDDVLSALLSKGFGLPPKMALSAGGSSPMAIPRSPKLLPNWLLPISVVVVVVVATFVLASFLVNNIVNNPAPPTRVAVGTPTIDAPIVVSASTATISPKSTDTPQPTGAFISKPTDTPRPIPTPTLRLVLEPTSLRPPDRTKYILSGHSGVVSDVAFSPDGRFVVTASYDQQVQNSHTNAHYK